MSAAKAFAAVGQALLGTEVKTATKYLSPSMTVRATRVSKHDKGRISYVVSVGKPNYLERKFIKLLKKAGEPFPVRKVQLRMAPQKRRAARGA